MVDALAAGRGRRRPRGQAAEELGYTPARADDDRQPGEAEGRGDDMPKIARVIYNRLETRRRADQRHARDRRDRQLRPRAQRSARLTSRRTCAVGLAVQHLQERRPAAGPDRGAGRRRRSRRPRTRPTGDWLYYVTVEPRRPARPSSPRLRRAPDSTRRELQDVLRRPPTPADVSTRRALRRAGRPDRPLAVAGAAPGGVRRARPGLGATTPSRVGRGGLGGVPRRARTTAWRGLSLTMPLKRDGAAAASTR